MTVKFKVYKTGYIRQYCYQTHFRIFNLYLIISKYKIGVEIPSDSRINSIMWEIGKAL